MKGKDPRPEIVKRQHKCKFCSKEATQTLVGYIWKKIRKGLNYQLSVWECPHCGLVQTGYTLRESTATAIPKKMHFYAVNPPWNQKPNKKTECAVCEAHVPTDQAFVEIRPTGVNLEPQSWTYCEKCRPSEKKPLRLSKEMLENLVGV